MYTMKCVYSSFIRSKIDFFHTNLFKCVKIQKEALYNAIVYVDRFLIIVIVVLCLGASVWKKLSLVIQPR